MFTEYNDSKLAKFIKKAAMVLPMCGMFALVGCGGAATNFPSSGSNGGGGVQLKSFGPDAGFGTVQIRIADAPLDRAVAFELTFSSVTALSSTGATVEVLSNPTSVEVTHLANTNEPLVVLDLPAGEYTELDLNVTGAKLTYLDPNTNQPVQKIFTEPMVSSVALYPTLTVGDEASIVNVDVDLKNTIYLDLASGTVGMNPPVLHVTSQPVLTSGQQTPENGSVEHVIGQVSSVTESSFQLTLGQTGSSLTFYTDENTAFGSLSLDSLQGKMIEVVGSSTADGGLLASRIDSLGDASGAAVEGTITGYTGSSAMNLVAQDGNGANFTADVLSANFSLTSDENTTYSVNTDNIDMTGLSLTFDANSIKPGQRVLAQSVSAVQPDGQGNGSMDAVNHIELQPQSLIGSVTNYVADETPGMASFDLVLSSDNTSYLTGASSVTMLHVYQRTTTDTRSDSLTNGSSIQVRGLLFSTNSQQPAFSMVATRISDFFMIQ